MCGEGNHNKKLKEVLKLKKEVKRIGYIGTGLKVLYYVLGIIHGIDDCIVLEDADTGRRTKCKICYHRDGSPYFSKLGIRYNISEIVRI